ncbi:MAG: hypothetical protein DRO05_07770 [Thermoproteota archaeon]|nr:MAG: hypothetical protein DRO05_07770 [Candidatus Korarchaeota archaeon]
MTASWSFNVKLPQISPTPSPTPAPKCIIATATYGSELAAEVQFLREFRDEVVSSTFAGGQFLRVFNAWYYSFSPRVARFIAEHQAARAFMRTLLYPLIGILKLSSKVYSFLSLTPELGIVMAGLVASSLIGIVYFSIPFAAVVRRTEKQLKVLAVSWPISLALLLAGEILVSPIAVMVSTASFVLITLGLSATIVSSCIRRFL